jgi:hypothetical protein
MRGDGETRGGRTRVQTWLINLESLIRVREVERKATVIPSLL